MYLTNSTSFLFPTSTKSYNISIKKSQISDPLKAKLFKLFSKKNSLKQSYIHSSSVIKSFKVPKKANVSTTLFSRNNLQISQSRIKSSNRNSQMRNSSYLSGMLNYSKDTKTKSQSIDEMNKTIMVSSKMMNDYYLKTRKIGSDTLESSGLYTGMIKSQSALNYKVESDFRDIEKYDKKSLELAKENFNRNLEYVTNHNKIRARQRIRENKGFYMLKELYEKKNKSSIRTRTNPLIKSRRNKNRVIRITKYQEVPETQSTQMTPRTSSRLWSVRSTRADFGFVTGLTNNTKFISNERKYKNARKQYKKFREKVNKRNLDKIDKGLRDMIYDFKNYEEVGVGVKRKNELGYPAKVNRNNLDRLIKVNTILRHGLMNDDFENNGDFIRKFGEISQMMGNKYISGFLPRFAKSRGFSNLTLRTFREKQGIFFGKPV